MIGMEVTTVREQGQPDIIIVHVAPELVDITSGALDMIRRHPAIGRRREGGCGCEIFRFGVEGKGVGIVEYELTIEPVDFAGVARLRLLR